MPYQNQSHFLVAIDCIIFGFDGEHLKILLIKRGFEPEKNKWSLMGGFLQPSENTDEAAIRVLYELTGLKDVYLEQLSVFSSPERDTVERTISVAYFALIDINKYKKQLNDNFHAEWFSINAFPALIFDHCKMVDLAKRKIQYKSAIHPVLFELMPDKFTIPQLYDLYIEVYGEKIDKANFIRKLLATNLLIRLNEKDKSASKKGAFYYKLDKKSYLKSFQSFINLIPNPENLTY